MASVIGMLRRNWQSTNPPTVPKSNDALKFGILGAANIAWVLLQIASTEYMHTTQANRGNAQAYGTHRPS